MLSTNGQPRNDYTNPGGVLIPSTLDQTYQPSVKFGGITEEMRFVINRWYMRKPTVPVTGEYTAVDSFCPNRLWLYLIPNWSNTARYAASSTPVYRFSAIPTGAVTFATFATNDLGSAQIKYPAHLLKKLLLRQTYAPDTTATNDPQQVPGNRDTLRRTGVPGERAQNKRQTQLDMSGGPKQKKLKFADRNN